MNTHTDAHGYSLEQELLPKFHNFGEEYHFAIDFACLAYPLPPIHHLNGINSILFPMNEMDHIFGKIVIFLKQYKILEIRKCYSMNLVFTFDIPEIVSPGT